MTVNYDFFDDVDPQTRARAWSSELQAGERPMPTRGARLCTLKEMSLQLAGFADERDGAVADGVAGRADPARRCAGRSSTASRWPDFDPNTPIRSKAEADAAAEASHARPPSAAASGGQAAPATASRPATRPMPQERNLKEAQAQ